MTKKFCVLLFSYQSYPLFATLQPKRIEDDAMAIDAMEMMEEHGISQLLVEKNGDYAGVIHIHDLIKEGII